MNHEYITKTFFSRTMNTDDYSSVSNQKGANSCLKCAKLRLEAWLRPNRLPRPLSRNGGDARAGRQERGDDKKGDGNPLKVKVCKYVSIDRVYSA